MTPFSTSAEPSNSTRIWFGRHVLDILQILHSMGSSSGNESGICGSGVVTDWYGESQSLEIFPVGTSLLNMARMKIS